MVLGEHDIFSDRDCQENRCSDPVQIHDVDSITVHPSFNNRQTVNDDIALIRLKKKITFTGE